MARAFPGTPGGRPQRRPRPGDANRRRGYL